MCNSPMREELKLLTNRLELAKKRREAISLEAKQLNEEIPHLEALIRLYDSRPYDSIVEERRVTSGILKATSSSHSSKRKQATPKGMLLKTMLEIFYDFTNGISYKALGEELSKRMGYKVASNGVYTNLIKLKTSTDAERVVKNNGVYILEEYLNDNPLDDNASLIKINGKEDV